jgi:MtN3 and saliva related transmembrane protein
VRGAIEGLTGLETRMGGWWPTVLGTVAGLCSTASFVPQVVKAWREGDTGAISKRMYVITVTAFALWIGYGVLIGSWPIIVFNTVSLLLSGTILVLKIREGRRR